MQAPLKWPDAKAGVLERVNAALATLHRQLPDGLAPLSSAETINALTADGREALLSLASAFLIHESTRSGGDPVARFHMDNGARLERINFAGNLSTRGLKESAGLMVNYLYDLSKVEELHENFVNGEVGRARGVNSLI